MSVTLKEPANSMKHLTECMDEVGSEFIGVMECLQDELMSKEEWAEILRINRNTLRDWEEKIVKARSPIKLFFYKGRAGRYKYDAYQRFITLVIYTLKQKKTQKGVTLVTSKDVIEFFDKKINDLPVWRILGRDNFTIFMESKKDA